jgi:hypothetical protein
MFAAALGPNRISSDHGQEHKDYTKGIGNSNGLFQMAFSTGRWRPHWCQPARLAPRPWEAHRHGAPWVHRASAPEGRRPALGGTDSSC